MFMAEETLFEKVIKAGEAAPKRFRVFFLKDDEESIEIVESEQIFFNDIMNHLEQGGSVFISQKRIREYTAKGNKKKGAKKNLTKLYFAHV